MGSPSLGSQPCELEANQERPVSPHPGTRVNLRPTTALPEVAPLRIRSPNAQIPRTAAFPIRESSNPDIQNYVSALQEEMQKRWQSPLRTRQSQNLRSPTVSPRKKKPATYRWTPPDQEISAILRATSPRSPQSPATPQSVRRLVQEEQQRHSPSRALSSHPAKPPSPPPTCPLPDVPRDRKLSNASSASDYEDVASRSPQRQKEAEVHPLFREQDGTRITPSKNAFAIPARSPLRRSLTAPLSSDGSLPSYQGSQASPHHAVTGYRQPGSTAAESMMPTIRHVSNTTAAPPSSPSRSEYDPEQERPASPTPSQRREDRTRARKLRHLHSARTRDAGVRTGGSTQTAPRSLGRFDTRPSTAISSTPTMMSDTTAETSFTSPTITIIKESPQLEERGCTPTPSPRSLRKGTSPIPAPLRFDLNPALGGRLSQKPEPSPPFPYDDPAFSADSTLLPSSTQDLRELLPPIHLPPLKSLHAQKDRGISASSAGTQLANDNLPHQRLSFASTLSHLDRHAAQHRETSKQQTSPGQAQKSPQHATHTHQASSTTAASGTSNAQASSQSAKSHVPSRESLDLRVAHLERQNTLLEAALMAVLRTGGLLNGCPCQASHFSPSSTRPTSPGAQKRATLVNKRLSALYDGAADRKRLSSTSSAPSRLSRRLSAFPATPTSAAGRSQKQQMQGRADMQRDTTEEATADLKRQLSELSSYSKRSGHSQGSQHSQGSMSSRCTDRSGASSDSQARRYSAALELYMATRLDVRSIPGSVAAAVVGGSRGGGSLRREGSRHARNKMRQGIGEG